MIEKDFKEIINNIKKDDELVQQLVAQVPWGHNIVLK